MGWTPIALNNTSNTILGSPYQVWICLSVVFFPSNFCYLDSFCQAEAVHWNMYFHHGFCFFFSPENYHIFWKLMFGFRWLISLLKCSLFRLDIGSFSGGNFHWPRPRPKLAAEVCLCMGKGFPRDLRSGASRSLAGLDEIDLKPRFLVVSGKVWGFLYIFGLKLYKYQVLFSKDLFFSFEFSIYVAVCGVWMFPSCFAGPYMGSVGVDYQGAFFLAGSSYWNQETSSHGLFKRKIHLLPSQNNFLTEKMIVVPTFHLNPREDRLDSREATEEAGWQGACWLRTWTCERPTS